MSDGKLIQKAGENSQQIQAQTVIVNNGITEERARSIFSEMIPLAIQEYTQDAYRVAEERIGQFEQKLMPRIVQVEQALPAFGDPKFQFLLRRAQQTAASTERLEDYELLSELLVCHVQKGSDRKNRTGISRAVEIVDEIDNDALCALTVAQSIVSFLPTSDNCLEGLAILNNLFGKLMYQRLPSGEDWLDHLDTLGTVRLSSFGNLKKFIEIYPVRLNGYACIGIKNGSDEHKRAVDLLHSVHLNSHILKDNECLSGYLRLPVPNRDSINILSVKNGLTYIPINNDQIIILNQVWDLYHKDAALQQTVNSNFMQIWDRFESLHKLKNWWESIPVSFEVTKVGKVLAFTNAKRCDPEVPDLVL